MSTPLHILLVEDDEINAYVAAHLLEQMHYKVRVVDNGAQALEALSAEPFDLVLMDIQLPGMNGVEATRRIRDGQAGEDRADIPIVAITAYAMLGDKEKILSQGLDSYVSKPFEIDLLRLAIDEAMSRRTRQS